MPSLIPLASALLLFQEPSKVHFLSHSALAPLSPALSLPSAVDLILPYVDTFACISYSNRFDIAVSIWNLNKNNSVSCLREETSYADTDERLLADSLEADQGRDSDLIVSENAICWDLRGQNIFFGMEL